MAGSQLKKLKAALKENGLTGQANVKHKKTTKKAPSDSRRDEKAEIINRIREQFNPFEVKVTKNKFSSDDRLKKGAVGKPGISKQIGEDARKAAWEAKKITKNRNGLLKDRRFGEKDSTLTPEERMLERFTREKQASAKKSLYNLDDSDQEEEPFGESLTHYGQSLSLTDDFQEKVDDGDDSDDEFMKPKKRTIDSIDGTTKEDAAPRKKTKAEIMQEVIAKSKHYKKQRQLLKEQNDEKIMDLDDDFDDIMSDLRSVPKVKPAPFADTSKESSVVNYEQSVRELNMERRAAPADRTKTEEEIRLERAKKMRELEEARERRMRGEDPHEDRGADDLTNDFWVQGSGDEGEEGFAIEEDAEDHEAEEAGSDIEESEKAKNSTSIICPGSHEQFLDILEEVPFGETLNQTNKIINAYAARLQAGNKEKLSIFTVIIFQHILYLSESRFVDEEDFSEIQNGLIAIVKKLTEKYSMDLTEALRDKIDEMHERIQETIAGTEEFPRISDLTCFALIGVLYSTSDHYHLVVTPSLIVMGEALEQLKFNSLNSLISGVFIAEVSLKFQRISKRYIPEIVFFLQKALLSLLPTDLQNKELNAKPDAKFPLPSTIKESADPTLRLSDIENEEFSDSEKVQLLEKILSVLELALDTWKEKSALIEISNPFMIILEAFSLLYPDFRPLAQLSLKFTRLVKFARDERTPLTLQSHKKLAIASYAPKYEENFNPEKKSYDHDRSRQEINKMKALIKQERKITLREIRKDTRFEARQQITEKKAAYDSYHSKMSKIMNTINTVEGAEKNVYEREKKQGKNRK